MKLFEKLFGKRELKKINQDFGKIDSRKVTKEINSVIRPTLIKNGFKKNNGRTYWRHLDNRIDIINFESFGSRHSIVSNCTSFSFRINFSIFLNWIPESNIKEINSLKKPKEYEGHFRRRVNKNIEQKEFKSEDVWFIDENGKNLSSIILKCNSQIENELKWFEKFNTSEKILELLLDSEYETEDGIWSIGTVGSANRNRMIAYTATELKMYELSIEKLNSILRFYKTEHSKNAIEYYLEKIKETKKELKKIKTTHNTVQN